MNLALHHNVKQFPVNTTLPLVASVLQKVQISPSTRPLWMPWEEGLVNLLHHRNYPWMTVTIRSLPRMGLTTCRQLDHRESLEILAADETHEILCRKFETCSTARRASMDESRLIDLALRTGKPPNLPETRSFRASQVCRPLKIAIRRLDMIRRDLQPVFMACLLRSLVQRIPQQEESHKTAVSHSGSGTGDA